MPMKTVIKTFLIIALVAFAYTSCASGGKVRGLDELDIAIREASDYLNKNLPAMKRIVILNITSDSSALSDYVIDELIANAVNDRNFSVVERQQLNVIRAEQNFQLSGEVDDNLALAIGKFFEAHYIISGRISRIDKHYRMNIRALNVLTAQVQGQYNRNITKSKTITALINTRSGAGTAYPGAGQIVSTGNAASAGSVDSGTSGGQVPTGSTPQAATPPAQPAAPANGTYTFWPRPQATQSGADTNVYIDRVTVRGGYLNIYFVDSPQGRGNRPRGIQSEYWSSFYGTSKRTIQDLDNPRRSWDMVSSGTDDVGGGIFLSFQGVTASRFSFTNSLFDPPLLFEGIILGEPDK